MGLINQMSTELLSPEVELDMQDVEEEHRTAKDLEQEIECPRCYDVMVLSSDFDRLLYFCQECGLSLVMK
jgi:transcription elongation factor Elf1